MSRPDLFARVVVGTGHLDVRLEYEDGPVPCIVQRVTDLAEVAEAVGMMVVDITEHLAAGGGR